MRLLIALLTMTIKDLITTSKLLLAHMIMTVLSTAK